jgi:hypothetical protein
LLISAIRAVSQIGEDELKDCDESGSLGESPESHMDCVTVVTGGDVSNPHKDSETITDKFSKCDGSPL